MNPHDIVSLIALACVIGWGAGLSVGDVVAERRCADQAVADHPAPWWQKALIHARARKEADAIEQKGGK
jgi:hypothetical protein